MAATLHPDVLTELKNAAGPGGWLTDAAALEPHVTEWRGLYRGTTPVLLAPDSTATAVQLVRICAAAGVAMVPQGGNTGLAGGAIPGLAPERPEVVLSSARLNRIRSIDPDNFTATVEAGVVLAALQTAVAERELHFPLSLAAEGSCQLGGNISTNAGGTNVLRYGNTRDLVLGLEVVLPDGSLYEGLRGLRKDNTGYDLKQLFIGAEGTLGFITAATVKLFPRPRSTATAWLALPTPADAVELYARARSLLGDEMVAFELVPRRAIDMVLASRSGARDPLPDAHPWYVLLEFAGAGAQLALDEQVAGFLEHSMTAGWVGDAVLATSEAQRHAFWGIRHAISEAQKQAGASIKHDVSVPVSRIAEFLEVADAAVAAAVPGIRPVPFGHLGDGNLHYNLSQPETMPADAFLQRWTELNEIVHGIAVSLGGSFSAEHGIGYLKTAELERLTGTVELELMRRIKAAVDPHNLMNPDKVLR